MRNPNMLRFCSQLRDSGQFVKGLGAILLGLCLCFASPAAAQLAIGGNAGAAIGASKDNGLGGSTSNVPSPSAFADFVAPNTVNAAFSYGGEVAYRYHGLVGGVLAQEVKIPITSDNGEIGVFRLRATLFTVGFQTRPATGKGIAVHATGGFGFARTDFKQGQLVSQLSQQYRSKIVTATTDPPAYMFGVGFDYFVSSHASITFFEMRGFWATANTTWTAVDRHPNITFADVSPLRGSNLQIVGGVRFWIH